MIAIVDYGSGNLYSVVNALNYLKLKCVVTKDKKIIEESARIILPGVGAFPDAKKMLDEAGLTDFLVGQGRAKPFLGICLGAQLLFDKGCENGIVSGLGLIEGTVEKISGEGLKIPHMGWNSIITLNDCPLLEGVEDKGCGYFVHSYKIKTRDEFIGAYCQYGEKIPAIVQRENIFGCQFHPEKSGAFGLKILNNFGRL